MAGKREQQRGGKPKPLVDRYTYITSVKAGNRTLAWLAIDRKTKRVVVAAPVGKARLLSLKHVRGLAPGHLAPIIRLLKTPESSQLPGDLAGARPVGIAIADYVPGDTLHARLKLGKLPPIEAVNLCAQVVRAVRAMHEAGTAHGAISPRAVIISPKGKWSAPVVTQLIAPTSGAFSSRERLQKRGPSFEDDSWAAHATLHAALTAEGPFAGKTREELLQNMFGGKPRRLDEFGMTEPQLQKIIDAGLVTNPRFRATLEQLEKSLERWLTEQGKLIQSLPPGSSEEPMFPKDDAAAIMVSEPPPQNELSSAVPLPRPHGKSLVGIVIDEPLDADAPAFAPPQRPEDLLDAVDDEEEADDVSDEARTRIYDPGTGHPLERSGSSAPPPAGGATESEPPTQAIQVGHLAPSAPQEQPAEAAMTQPAVPLPVQTPGGRAAKPKRSVTGSGQALAAALALAVAAVVTLFVRFRSDQDHQDSGPTASPSVSQTRALSPEAELAACVAGYFPEEGVDTGQSFGFLCEAGDLRSTANQLENRILGSHGAGAREARKAWDGLGWFQLPLVASLRHRCCEREMAERVILPQPPPACKSLSVVIKSMTAPPLSAGDLPGRAQDFERAVACLTEEKQGSAYGHEAKPTDDNRKAFREFLERGAKVHED